MLFGFSWSIRKHKLRGRETGFSNTKIKTIYRILTRPNKHINIGWGEYDSITVRVLNKPLNEISYHSKTGQKKSNK